MLARSFLGVAAVALAALVWVGSAAAAETRTPFTQEFFNPCTAELLVATGTLVFRADLKIGPSGSTHESSHMSFHGTSATAPVSGRKYVVQDQTIEGSNSHLDGAQTTTHFRIKVHWVRTGESGALLDDDDFYDWWNIHLTTNANGVPTSLKIDTAQDVCR